MIVNMVIMVTGGAGFIGSNFIRYWLSQNSKDIVVNVDVLTYAGIKENLEDVERKYPGQYFFEKVDICDYDAVEAIIRKHRVSTIVNFAAESHNSYAIHNPSAFFRTNVMGTQTLLEAARHHDIQRFHQVSTCEVFGDLDLNSDEKFREDSPLLPNTPYNASKAGANLAAMAYYKTYQLPVTLSNCSNNYGPFQFPEKLIPLFATNLMQDKPIPLYRESQNKREWLHVFDHNRAIELILKSGKAGEAYNIGSGIEKSVEEISDLLLKKFNKPADRYKTYVPSRPSHDRRYLLDSSKIRTELGWEPKISFEDGLDRTVDWYIHRRDWWEKLLDLSPVSELDWKR